MNQHGRRFLTTQQFRSHAGALKVLGLNERELEFYEQHCLLLPAARTHILPAHATAPAERSDHGPLTQPEEWRRLHRGRADGLHPFDAEEGRNPFLVTPDCSTFEPWDTSRVRVITPDGRTVSRPMVERYYAPWQVHAVQWLRQRKYYYVHSQFLSHIDRSHELWKRHSLPEPTEAIRSLQGMAAGFEAVELFLFAEQAVLLDAHQGTQAQMLSEATQEQVRALLRLRAARSLEMSGLDQRPFFEFLAKLTALVADYRTDERFALAQDAEDYLLDALELAGHALALTWGDVLTAAGEIGGPHLVAELQQLDPVETAARGARQNLKEILTHDPVPGVLADPAFLDSTADELVKFCQDHDLLEVLSSLDQYSYTADERRRDPLPGFFNRRLRPLALAGEHLLRGIWEAAPNVPGAEEGLSHQGKPYTALMEELGVGASWLPIFQKLVSTGHTSDKKGKLEERALRLAKSASSVDVASDEAIATTLVVAVAARNLVSHRHRFLPSQTVRALSGRCVDAVALVWLLAKGRGLV